MFDFVQFCQEGVVVVAAGGAATATASVADVGATIKSTKKGSIVKTIFSMPLINLSVHQLENSIYPTAAEAATASKVLIFTGKFKLSFS